VQQNESGSRDVPKARGRGGRRLTARDKLIAAGYDVMSRNGLESSTIVQIIEEAGVGVGSFYNHFESKEDLAKAIFADRAEAFGAMLEQTALSSTNIAAATCFAFRQLIEKVESDAMWAAFIVQLEPSMQMMDGLLRDHARTAITFGVDRGMLKIDNVEAGITAIHAVMFAIAKSVLTGGLSSQEAHRSSLFALRMFGVEEDEAVRLSRMPMASLRHELTR
jgi:AcrR family transcriptional regulator